MIVFGCCILCVLYILATMRQDFYHAWMRLIPVVAACHIALWNMPGISATLEKFFSEGDLRLLQPFCKSAAILLTGVAVLIVLRVVIGKIGPLTDPEFPSWLDRPASLAARIVTVLMVVTLLVQSALVLPMAATVSEFQPTAEKADSIVLFSSRLLNRLSGQSSYNERQREELARWRAFSRQEAERIAQREREEQLAREEQQRQAAAAAAKKKKGKKGAQQQQQQPPPPEPAKPTSIPEIFNRAKSQLQTIYDNHNQNLEQEMPQGTPAPQGEQQPQGTPAPQGEQQPQGTPAPQGEQQQGTPAPQGEQQQGTPAPQGEQQQAPAASRP